MTTKHQTYCDRYGHTWRRHPTDSRYEVCVYSTGKLTCGAVRRGASSSPAPTASASAPTVVSHSSQEGPTIMTQTATPKTDSSIWNQITLTGNLGQDPEMSFTKSGNAVTKFSLGVSQGKDKPTMWVNIETWKDLAEQCNSKLAKGTRVEIAGRLVQDVWTNKEGNKRYAFKAVAQTVRVLKRSASAERSSGFIDEDENKADDLGDLDENPF